MRLRVSLWMRLGLRWRVRLGLRLRVILRVRLLGNMPYSNLGHWLRVRFDRVFRVVWLSLLDRGCFSLL